MASETAPIDLKGENFSTPAEEACARSRVTISEYFADKIGRDAFLNEFGTSAKIRGYVNSILNLRPVYEPIDLKNYPEIKATADNQQKEKYMTQKHVQGIKHFFTYIEKYHNKIEFNGFPLTQWRAFYPDMNIQIGQNTPKEKSMSGHNKDIETSDVLAWYPYIRDDMRPWYLLLLYSGARETHLYAALSDENKKIERLGGESAKGKYTKLQKEILFVDATGTVEEGGKSKKMEFGFMFPVELEKVVREYLPPIKSTVTRKRALSNPGGAPADLMKVGAANTRKWNTNIMISSGNLSGEEIDNIQGRSLNSVQNTNYADMKFKVANAYSRVVDEMVAALPIPDSIIRGEFGNKR